MIAETPKPRIREHYRPFSDVLKVADDVLESEGNQTCSRSLQRGYQRSVGLCNSTARCRCVGDSVEHDEIVDRADVAGAGDAHAGLPQLARVSLTFVSEYIVLGGDDESVGQPLELIAGCLVRVQRQVREFPGRSRRAC
jgi:hypothetical protein